ncbi:MAG: phosphate ABC transporter, permease protein PstA, partial [Ignavibacteriaceae bacterium]|nr:phosphate ABC transporter, permease protein PstA [Ignavibacteriaceae bacterium]
MELKKRKIDLAGFISLGLVRFTFYALVILLILLLGKIFVEGIGVISLNFLIDEPTNNMTEGGIGPAIFGTIAVTLLMVLFAVPLGVCSAIYLNEYAKDSLFTRLIRTSINNLAGVPSIVFGLFGLGFFILFIGKNLDSVLQTGLLFGQPALLWASA